MFGQPIVSIPNLSHTTVEQILTINSHLIKILSHYQNNGWLEEPEYKIQAAIKLDVSGDGSRLHGQARSRKTRALMNTPNLAPVGYPEKLRPSRRATTASSSLAPTTTTTTTTTPPENSGSNASLNQITMVVDPNAADPVNDMGNVGVEYKPVPAFPLSNLANGQLPPGVTPAAVLNASDTRRRLTGG
ncbi:hypothetical protein BCR33DRAFT_779533 [Rhizoclosmatium globosum]|uniref:Uncharacterized protein n=1 Tax=Rhizoclosmatium globosum TaxID=329046 RepID=A0A1Y2D269_9FUNG|nr:hypothetical protein BCR33DRAFT_779533 [Rhizoclosmatium globosum]|eukprot:ORY53216.1 hypothetical protein BCR33DRAFT_779533 [Rhizoclosmatium globosum]